MDIICPPLIDVKWRLVTLMVRWVGYTAVVLHNRRHNRAVAPGRNSLLIYLLEY
jgi:hypothetical protein